MISAGMIENERTAIAARYRQALRAHHGGSRQEWLAGAYDIGRAALDSGLSLSEMAEIHHTVAADLVTERRLTGPELSAIDEFLVEVIAVYDMALQGYRDSIVHLQAEIAERRRIEDRLRELGRELARQRDELDDQVRARTQQLRDQAARLHRTNRQLRQINREQSEFTYAISHDLRSPTNTLSMLLDELGLEHAERLDEDGRELLSMCRTTVGRMGRLIVDVLEYSRSIQADFEPEPVDLGVLVREVCADLRSELVSSGGRVRIGALPVLRGSRLQFRMLFQNLISNAIKFRRPGRPPVVRIDARAEGDGWIVSVADNGIGIAPENRERIFGLFQRLHTQNEYAGSGLGLTLCQRIVGNHNGRIRLRSEPGVGSTFELYFGEGPNDTRGDQQGDPDR